VTTASARDEGFAESSMPRSNGSPVFDVPWQARAHALAVLSVEATGHEWEDFRRHLIAAINESDQRPYWDSWVAALDTFIAECGLVA
jgi:hypothetical protein